MITLLIPPNTFGCCASASGSLIHSEAFTRYLNSCVLFLGRETSVTQMCHLFLTHDNGVFPIAV